MAIAGKGLVVVGVIWGQIVLSAIFIGLRFYTRQFIKATLGWDDYTLMATWVRSNNKTWSTLCWYFTNGC
jgi:hypothetical protein